MCTVKLSSMEKLYRKKDNGKYECVGYDSVDLHDGIWIVQTTPYSKSLTNLVWRVGELKRPIDIVTHASLQTMEHDVAKYLRNLQDETTIDYQEAKKMLGGYLQGKVGIIGISTPDLSSLILRQIAIKIEEDGQKNN
jgi:hypothetical protein